MKNILILFAIFALISCKSKQMIVTTDLNVVAKVVKIETCKSCIDGGFIYTLEINPEEKEYMKYITDCIYKKGDLIYFKTIIQKETYE